MPMEPDAGPAHRGPAVQDRYPDDFAWCYGCGRHNPAGLHLKTYPDGDETVTVFEPRPEHMAVPGFVYGGLIASLIDCHSMATASLALYRRDGHRLGDPEPVPRCVTASLKVDYLRPTPLGVPLTVRGRVVELGQRKAVVESELYAGETLCARGQVVAVLAPPAMTPGPAGAERRPG
ncbi:uncharacterized protein, possibly involved in aromatic compounds catabolism [Thermaerobacter subterraneus DSM 13965]|uniref:Acyl-coenzyme A thioesterase THEM4 n=2 Tax=Thermaerobacter TaxID=73918 RepID=K6QCQ5_9FIRM|nr:uncharacterized protein, possibly involved in aromatic compounds catabolism [Thermaerobacter subterraneus DSM 13965]